MLPVFRWLRRAEPKNTLLPEPDWATVSSLPVLTGLSPAEALALRRLAARFLEDKRFEPAGGMALADAVRARIAALACLPLLGLDYGWCAGWRTVIVYPGSFVRPRSEFDDIGVLHQWEDVLGGESWERGPIVLSWADLEASGRGDGYNVAVHEMAHKLDMLNGPPDGFPPLHKDMDPGAWTASFSTAYADLNARLDRGEDTEIDPYAAEEPGEFFAVLSEYFFERPRLIQAEYPEVYRQLARFYRQDPAARLMPVSP
jgi:Mlc titration factor MtfA (ptsG expression regulator)